MHPLDTLLAAAGRLAGDPAIVFCFIGGGSEWRKIKELISGPSAARYRNFRCLPYQPLAQLSASLSAGDLQVIVMGNAFVGLVHPCKLYNILGVAAPVLYLGPRPSHVTEILDASGPEYPHAAVAHGDVDGVVQSIQRLRQRTSTAGRPNPTPALIQFSQAALLPRVVAVIEGTDASVPVGN